MSQNKIKKDYDNNLELKTFILKDISEKIDLIFHQQFHQRLDIFIEKKVDLLIHKKFDEIFEDQLKSKINSILEDYFKAEDLSILQSSIERRLKELINKNENDKSRNIK